MEDVIVYFALKYEGDFNKIYQAILKKEKVNKEEWERMRTSLKCCYTTVISDDYPEALKQIPAPPFVLFYYGDIRLCEQICISMVGMRECSEYGKMMAIDISEKLARSGKVIVSGMAKGIDAYSHLGCMNVRGKTIAVLGSGIDYCYPNCNRDLYERLKQDHLVMSEYPNDLAPQKEFFKRRNRIVAGLGEKLVVVEAEKRSGTMISVGYALEQGKEVYCVPSRYYDAPGCNDLIAQGANILADISELF